jgi:hypothetical protein
MERYWPVCAENSDSNVLVMQPTDHGVRHDSSDPLNGPRDRWILVQRTMRSRGVVIAPGPYPMRCGKSRPGGCTSGRGALRRIGRARQMKAPNSAPASLPGHRAGRHRTTRAARGSVFHTARAGEVTLPGNSSPGLKKAARQSTDCAFCCETWRNNHDRSQAQRGEWLTTDWRRSAYRHRLQRSGATGSRRVRRRCLSTHSRIHPQG